MENEKHKAGLNVPEGYFESFEDRMMLKIMEDGLPDSAGFKVPNGYFDSLEDRVMERVFDEEEPKVINLFRRRTLYYVAGVAACVVLVVSLFNNFGNELSMNDLSAASIENYINDGGMDIDSYDVMALLDEDELSEIKIPSEVLSEENLEDYLIENIDETSLLIE